jgi:hypothetical protein
MSTRSFDQRNEARADKEMARTRGTTKAGRAASRLARRLRSTSEWLDVVWPQASADDLSLLVRLELALASVRDLAAERDIPAEAVALRIEQLAASAEGVYCPEAAFDPAARSLLEIAGQLEQRPRASELWPEWARAVKAELASARVSSGTGSSSGPVAVAARILFG